MENDDAIKLGKFIRERTDAVYEQAQQKIVKEVSSVQESIEETKKQLSELFDELNTKIVEGFDDSESRRTLSVLKTQEIFNDKLEALESDLTSAISEKYVEFGDRAAELDESVSKLVEATEEEAAEIRKAHVEQIQKLTEQLKQQQEFEAMLIARIEQIKDGEQGEKGEQGEPGEPGLDRPLLEPLVIDDNKDYPKSVLGSFNNGLWISTKSTVGGPESDPHSWHCVLDAIATMRFDLQKDHTYKLSVRMSTGQLIEDDVYIPYHEHKGIYEDGASYKAGNWVTKGSCIFQAMEDTDKSPPGNGWQQILAAKRGSKGEKGDPGEKGEQGRPGRNGLDATLPPGFTEQLLEMANRAFEDGRSGAYAVTSFRGWFSPNERYAAGDLVNFDGALYLCITAGTYRNIFESSGAFEYVIGASKVGSGTKYMNWRGDYDNQIAYMNQDVVRDGAWTMVSLTHDNTDRPAPQPIGASFYPYGGTMGSLQQLSSTIIYGNRYSFEDRGGYVNGFRLYTFDTLSYRVFSVVNPIDNPVFNELVSFTASSTGWVEFNISQVLAAKGALVDLIVFVDEPNPTPVTFNGNYYYDTPNNPGTPGSGVIEHANTSLSTLRISKTDNDGGDRSAELEGLVVGDRINSGGTWNIVTINDFSAYIEFGISPASQYGADGVRDFEFETVTPTPIDYGIDVDYWTNNASHIQGIWNDAGDYSGITLDGNAYGVDILVQEADVSELWDVVAYTPAGGTSTQISAVEADWLAVRATPVQFDNVTTTGNGFKELARFTVPENTGYLLEFVVKAKRTDAIGFGAGKYSAVVYRDTGPDVKSSVIYEHFDAGMRYDISIDGSDIVFQVDGKVNQTWEWSFDMDVGEL